MDANHQSFGAPEAEKPEPNAESLSDSDADSAESASDDREGEGEGEGLSESEGVGAAEFVEPRESKTLAAALSIPESCSQLDSGTVGSLPRVGEFGWV